MERENLPLLDLDIIEEVKINPVLVNLVLYAKSITDYMHHLVVVWRVQYYVLVQRCCRNYFKAIFTIGFGKFAIGLENLISFLFFIPVKSYEILTEKVKYTIFTIVCCCCMLNVNYFGVENIWGLMDWN